MNTQLCPPLRCALGACVLPAVRPWCAVCVCALASVGQGGGAGDEHAAVAGPGRGVPGVRARGDPVDVTFSLREVKVRSR